MAVFAKSFDNRVKLALRVLHASEGNAVTEVKGTGAGWAARSGKAMRQVLFVHQNFPGQFVHLASALAQSGQWEVHAIGAEGSRVPPGVALERYTPDLAPLARIDAGARRLVAEHRRGEAVAEAALRLKGRGVNPAAVIGHAGWGEMLFLRDVFPGARIASYLEFFFGFTGADVNFDPAFPDEGLKAMARVRARNAPALFAAADADILLTPTEWQKSRFPSSIRPRLRVLHEGVDTRRAAPHPDVALDVGTGTVLTSQDEVVTFVARNLEPYRGFHVFMRALPALLERRPRCQVVIIGADGQSYGRAAPNGRSWKAHMLDEVRGRIDPARVHFLGAVPYDVFLGAMQLTSAHVYLTYPFVLSWSILEAMACEAPIVASRTAPVEEVVVDGLTGRLVDFFDTEALAGAIARTLEEKEASRALARAARASVIERFDLRTRCLPAQLALVSELTG